jgi:hypothetical protein
MNVSLTNGWGIVRTIADLMLKQPEGKYVLVKDPNNVSCPPWSGAKADVTDYYPNLQCTRKRI